MRALADYYRSSRDESWLRVAPLILLTALGCARLGFETLALSEDPAPPEAFARSSRSCVSGACALSSCADDYDDCDGDPANGCEASLASAEHCGACHNACSFANAAASCMEGTCDMAECDAGYGDCDERPDNGCEVRLTNIADCGACGQSCSHDNAESTCTTGSCELLRCVDGYADCDGDPNNGCETPLNSLDNCGACGSVCDIAGTDRETCNGGICSAASCSESYADCDGDHLSCETNLQTLDNCGLCGSACGDLEGRLDNGTATCSSGSCAVALCDPGWANCDSSAATGCETPTTTNTDCGGCGTACALPHAEASCSTGTCQVTSCDVGWDDCDESPGCETDLSSDSHCGGCDLACSAGESCEAGECVPQFVAFDPSNFDPESLPTTSAPNLVLDCGSVALDTTTLTASDWCGSPAPPVVARAQESGPELAVVILRSLDIAAGTTLQVTGSRPVVFAVFGDVRVAGAIDASAQTSSGGPGENWQCADSDGTNGTGSSSLGGGGGGGGGFRADGGDGGDGDDPNRGTGGVPRGTDSLTPLVPGCRGGSGGGCGAGPGGGGGALQLSAAGLVQITGSLVANGGNGVDGCETEGGGSGGAILVEANELSFSGSLLAVGGDGGSGANGGDGGLGSSSEAGEEGISHLTNGGGGGGGSAGRIRLRGTSCSTGGTTAPTASISCP